MRMSSGAFNSHLRQMGHELAWRRSYACPCVNPGSGQGDPRCAYCAGKGRQWADEDKANIGKAGFVSQSAKKAMADFGVWEPGDAVLSIGSDCVFYTCGRFDRFRSTKSKHVFTDNLRAGFNARLAGSIDCIDRVFWLDAGKNLVEGSIPTVGELGVLTWADGDIAPPEGTTFSIAGQRWDEYYAFLDLPQNRPIGGSTDLPRKLPVRRFDLFGR